MTSLFSWTNRVDTAALLAGDQSSGLPVSNLAERIIQKVYRSGNSYSTYFMADFGSAVSLQLLALFGCTLDAADTVRHRLSAVAPGDGELLDTGAIACGVDDLYGAHARLLDAAVSARYWRCDVVATSRSADGYFDLGRAWAGEVFEPGIGFSLGWGEGFVDTAEVTRARHSGVNFPSEGAVYRSLTATFEWLDEDEKQVALTIDKNIGRRGQLVFVPDTSNLASCLIGRMKDTTPAQQPTAVAPARFSKSYAIEQDL